MSTPFLNFSRIICTNFRQGHASGFWGAGLCSWNCCHTFFAVFPQLFSSTRCVRRKIVQNKKFNALSYVELFLVGAGGFEPPKLKAADLQSVPIGHSGTRPYSFVSAARTACIYYHAQSSLSTICNRFYRNFCTNLSNKLAPWKNRPEINVPERFFLELVTGVEHVCGRFQAKIRDFLRRNQTEKR